MQVVFVECDQLVVLGADFLVVVLAGDFVFQAYVSFVMGLVGMLRIGVGWVRARRR